MSQNKRPQDHFGRRAKRDGFPARSVYKLEEIDRRVGLIKPGMRVLDLGASPGSWTLYAATRVGPKGKVLGLDIKPHVGALPMNAEIVVKDVFTVTAADFGGRGAFDLVISDMAPNTTGNRALDQYRSFELFMHALSIATRVLSAGGSFVGKIFQGTDFPEAQKAVQKAFETARVIRPEATRDVSYEVFLVGHRLKAEAATDPAPETP